MDDYLYELTYFTFRTLLNTHSDSILKPVLWFVLFLAEQCSENLFTMLDMCKRLKDLVKPIAKREVTL